MSVQQFIKSVASEKTGFVLGEAWRMSEESLNVIVPITRKSKKKRKYITLAEAQDVKVEDTGQVNYLYIQNNEKKPLLISRGELFRGKAQERVAIHGTIVMPGKSTRINVHCVHQSKPTSRGAEMKYGGRVPSDIDLSNQANTWSSVQTHNATYLANTGRGPKIKLKNTLKSRGGAMRVPGVLADHVPDEDDMPRMSHTYFASCNSTPDMSVTCDSLGSEERGSAGPDGLMDSVSNLGDIGDVPAADDLVDALDDMSSFIKEAMRKIPPIENQVGAIFIRENKLNGLDVYDLPGSWDAVKNDVVAKEGSSYLKKEEANVFEFKPEKVKLLIGKELGCKFEENIIFGETQKLPFKIIEIREVREEGKNGKLLRGEAVEFRGEVIQLTMYRN